MARLIFLDTGTLGIAARRRGDDEGDRCRAWIVARATTGRGLVLLPELADYEVRRGLLAAGATAGLRRLDELRTEGLLTYLPISTAAMLRAAELWAVMRRRGQPTADRGALDGDAILAGQALAYAGHGDEVIVATGNRKHLSRFPGIHLADEWKHIA